MTTEELIFAVLSNSKALWAIRTSSIKVAGPWVPARSEKRGFAIGGDASWRLSPKGETMACVHRWWECWNGIKKPHPTDYDYLENDEDYVRDLVTYKEDMELRNGREWAWHLDGNWAFEGTFGYASTKEEAIQIADVRLRERGVQLVDELDGEVLRKYSA